MSKYGISEDSLAAVALTLGAYVALPIAGAVKIAKVSVPIACIAWVIYFGGFVLFLRGDGGSWNDAFGWTAILNLFLGFGLLPVVLTAKLIQLIFRQVKTDQ